MHNTNRTLLATYPGHYSYAKEVSCVTTARLCRFYRDFCKLYSDSGSGDMGQSIGHCDLDCDQTTCNGGLDSCQKSDILKRYFIEQIRRAGGLEWEKSRSFSFSDNTKAWTKEKTQMLRGYNRSMEMDVFSKLEIYFDWSPPWLQNESQRPVMNSTLYHAMLEQYKYQ